MELVGRSEFNSGDYRVGQVVETVVGVVTGGVYSRICQGRPLVVYTGGDVRPVFVEEIAGTDVVADVIAIGDVGVERVEVGIVRSCDGVEIVSALISVRIIIADIVLETELGARRDWFHVGDASSDGVVVAFVGPELPDDRVG